MNQTRNLAIILIFAAIIVAGAIVATRNRMPGRSVSGQVALALGDPFFPDLADRIDEINQIKLSDSQTSTTLHLGENGLWNIAIDQGYPADQADVKRLLAQLIDLNAFDAITSRADRYPNFGLDPAPPQGGSIALLNAKGQTIAGVLLGSSRNNENADPMAMSVDGGLYMRRLGKDDPWVYLADNPFRFFSADTIEWINRSIPIYESSDDIDLVKIQHATTATVTIEQIDSGWTLTSEIPQGTQARSSALHSARTALSRLNIEGVLPADAKSLDIATTFTARLNNGAVYHAALSRTDDANYLHLSADQIQPVLPSASEDTTATLATIEKAKQVEKDVEAFNRRHTPWLYKINHSTASNLDKSITDIIEPSPKPQAAGDKK